MSDYAAPLADIRFVLEHICDLADLAALEAYEHATPDIVDAVLEEAGKLAAGELAPLNWSGDREGAQLVGTDVTTPAGFKDAYRQFVEGGWNGVPFTPEYGGQGLPQALAAVCTELWNASNMAFGLCPMLNVGAVECLTAHGSKDQQDLFLEKMISGAWTSTMNLTEPQAGSDVGAVRTKAEDAGDGTYRIFGQKIYITYGEHDMAENIVHLVLARLPDAPAGTKGISLFLVPKFMVEADGSLGARNDVKCVSIEHKLGIHGSPTCTMAYGEDGQGAVGHLIGEPNKGMRYMFTMMNSARLNVGIQGVSVADRATQRAVAFARERKQGRAVGVPATDSSEIVHHPDVRRMLLDMRAKTQAARAICYKACTFLDLAHNGADADARAAAQAMVDLLTPIAKAWSTDIGVDVASVGVQVHGGMGFIEETGAAQHLRDARIAPIYEGTNGIQAIDLVMRKLPMQGGAVIKGFLKEMRDQLDALAQAGNDDFAAIRANLEDAVTVAESTTEWLLTKLNEAPNDALAGATPYLELMGRVTGAHYLAKGALSASKGLAETQDPAAIEAQIALARFFAETILPGVKGLAAPVTAGAGSLFGAASRALDAA